MSQAKVKTRKSVKCPVFGYSCWLKSNVLPTYKDVMRHFQHVKYTLEAEGNLAPSVSKLCDICSAEMNPCGKKLLYQ